MDREKGGLYFPFPLGSQRVRRSRAAHAPPFAKLEEKGAQIDFNTLHTPT